MNEEFKNKELELEELEQENVESAEEVRKGPMSEEPQFEMLTNAVLECRNCRFRIPDGGVLRCHKYDMKPAEVLNRVPNACPKYKPERG